MIGFWRWAALMGLAGLDAIALAVLLGASPRGAALVAGGHVALSIVSTWALFTGNSPWGEGGLSLRVLACALALFIPVLGGPGVLLFLTSAFGDRPAEEPKWITVPIDGDHVRGDGRRGSRSALARVASLLRSREPETGAARFRALLEVHRFTSRERVAILRSCLKDSFDEVRLYAFARLERLRDDVESKTKRLTQRLQCAPSGEAPTLHLRIAESHWEACYLGLVEGAVLEDQIESAARHAAEALRLSPRNGAASFLLGRVHLRSRRYPEAAEQFQMALDAGFPTIRVLPYLAEAHFAQRHYAVVRRLTRDLAHLPATRALPGGVVELWG